MLPQLHFPVQYGCPAILHHQFGFSAGIIAPSDARWAKEQGWNEDCGLLLPYIMWDIEAALRFLNQGGIVSKFHSERKTKQTKTLHMFPSYAELGLALMSFTGIIWSL